ncbi:hypothetical protein [Actinomadura formosensis]|uniref:hypothetical protein n=1 Tax=Actinomadura formosensis TaxID=60706 RepID=UPI003D89EC02
MNWTALIVPVVIGLAINEYADFAPWIARKIVRRAARRMYAGKAERAEIRAEEWAAVINERPGKLFKLGTALGYCLAAQLATVRRSRYAGAIKRLAIRHLIVFPILAPQTLQEILAGRIGKIKAHIVTLAILGIPAVISFYLAFRLHSNREPLTLTTLVALTLATLPVSVALAMTSIRLYVRGAITVALIVLVRGGREERRKALLGARIRSVRRMLKLPPYEAGVTPRIARLTVHLDQSEHRGPDS